jgi:alpha-glutamyl/putrescinyl thymine pyrophosphorylase clade 1
VRQLNLKSYQAEASGRFVFPKAVPNIIVKLTPAKPTEVFYAYWYLATERQKVFFNRIANLPQPWTEDEIIQDYKFTNAYRASDRVSQYLIRNVLYDKHH